MVVSVLRPGVGLNADVTQLDTTALASYATQAKSHTTVEFLMNIIPSSVVDAFATSLNHEPWDEAVVPLND